MNKLTISEFTPGPWRVSDENRDDLERYARFGPVVVYANDDCNIHPIADCSCNHTCREDEEQIANANLISAAPDMYEALMLALPHFQGENSSHDEEIADEICAALAKARGQR